MQNSAGEGVQCPELKFQTVHCGTLTVSKSTDGLYHLSVPLSLPGPPSSHVSEHCDTISKVMHRPALQGTHCAHSSRSCVE